MNYLPGNSIIHYTIYVNDQLCGTARVYMELRSRGEAKHVQQMCQISYDSLMGLCVTS